MTTLPGTTRRRIAGRLVCTVSGCLGLLAGAIAAPSAASDWQFSASISSGLQVYPRPPAYAAQDARTTYLSLKFKPSLSYDWNGGDDRFTIAPYLWFDVAGNRRTQFDLRQASWLHIGDGWDFVVGIDKVFWGVAESRNLVDIVNQDDTLADFGGSEKLGQPMININFFGDYGTLGLFVLPGFRERAFADTGDRLSGPFPVIAGDATFEATDGAHNIDFALRWEQSLGNWDIGLSQFSGTSREPRLLAEARPGGMVLVPRYDLINQSGIDLQYTAGQWLLKLEAISRSGQGPRFYAAVAGFETTINGVFGSGADLSLMAEYNYDGRDMTLAPMTIFDDDVFLGARLALSDTGDTSITAGALIDRNTGSSAIFLQAGRRLGDNWKIELDGRGFVNIADSDPMAAIRNDSNFTLRLSRFF
ncbi:MAG: hypothetical protein ACC619_03045 [Paracoccaceae bacterium]